jgi:hypothetical protein
MRSLILTAALLALISPAAFAQTSAPNSSQMDAASSKNDQSSPGANAQDSGRSQNAAAIEKLRQDLQNAGFTDVKVVAQSFVVQARSKDGDPVLMTIGPHGMSIFEAMRMDNSGSGTTGMSRNGANSNAPSSGSSTSGSSSK